MAGWAGLKQILFEEVIQKCEEGCDVKGFKQRIEMCENNTDLLMQVYKDLCSIPVSKDFPFIEPDGYDQILSLASPQIPEPFILDEETLSDKMYGAWLGRCIGCALGKPFEKDPFVSGDNNHAGWVYIRNWLTGADAYPLSDYVPASSEASKSGLSIQCPSSQRGNISYMETDDDIRYLIIGLLISERFGNDFTPDQVMGIWQQYLPAKQCCTAELQAYINSLNTEIEDPEKRWEYIRTYLNPYREWIGALIRADQYGYVNAGNPMNAAKSAYQDASSTHAKNGIYGSIYVSTVIAAAFAENNPERCIEIGLSNIPSTSRLFSDIQKSISIAKRVKTQEKLFEELWSEFGHYNWVHTNNNAAACTASLIFGQGDFTKTLSAAVSCGWDTDCNGATVGSIIGAITGSKTIPDHLKLPLNDTLYSFIPGFHPISIFECAERSLRVFKRLNT